MYDGVLETVDVCGRHRAAYHERLAPFKVHSERRTTMEFSNDRFDAWGQAWQAREIRYWLRRFAKIDVSDRARLHPQRHIEPWKAAAGADMTLRDRVRAAMGAERQERIVQAKAKAANDPRLREKVLIARQAIQEARAEEVVAEAVVSRGPLFLEPDDRKQQL